MTESQTHRLLNAALEQREPVKRLGRAIWLYLALIHDANEKGLILRTPIQLAEELAVPESDITLWLSRLENSHLITILAPAPFLVVRLTKWSGKAARPVEKPHKTEASEAARKSIGPVSSLQSASAAADLIKAGGDGGPGEGVFAEAAGILGADAAEVEELLRTYPEPIIRRALHRVRNTPAHQIKKSRLALFRYLINRFSNDTHGHP